ncbi:hypothetical protein NNC19_06565 [Clostridium sp. SHJSY1]|uniref:hypothetical protein n=1 Tax=Clostridium sp. SHJSY1 TaxID=2942483 RepID=UPI00287522E1|nr:hypothetical protein [Clostridium sp. SHJSY1]MDS0525335.1 hypothetical protein [Clostridium sp. SHJSY1]
MNKKQLTMTLILGALMLLLIFTQRFFENNFKEVALVNSNMGELKEYSTTDGEFIYSLPNTWSLKNLKSDNYDIYKAEFKDDNNNIMGYVEIINSNDDVNSLAQKDLDNMVLSHDKEKIDRYKSNDRKCIKVVYKTKVNKGYDFVNINYYIPLSEGKMGKITFIVKENYYKDDMMIIFNSIVDEFIIK